ncbi:hypothetical protein D3C76_1499060 [compost metagenome]
MLLPLLHMPLIVQVSFACWFRLTHLFHIAVQLGKQLLHRLRQHTQPYLHCFTSGLQCIGDLPHFPAALPGTECISQLTGLHDQPFLVLR